MANKVKTVLLLLLFTSLTLTQDFFHSHAGFGVPVSPVGKDLVVQGDSDASTAVQYCLVCLLVRGYAPSLQCVDLKSLDDFEFVYPVHPHSISFIVEFALPIYRAPPKLHLS